MTDIEIQLLPVSFPEPPPMVISDESFLIGRDTLVFRTWKDARLKRLSREHARMEITGSAATLRDLGSTNGTKINNVPLLAQEPYPIRDGDVITFADVFKYEVNIIRCKSVENTVIAE
ncbi:MAG: FHA domain-containing protein [Gammaproteobacteria bacterium]